MDGEESTTLSRSLFQEKGWLCTKDRIVQVYGMIREFVTPSLVRCILTAQSLCCSFYSHRCRRTNFLYLYRDATTLFGGTFVWRKSVRCLCTNPPTSVTVVFSGKLRRQHEWLHGSDTVESPLISLQYMSSSVQTILRSGLGRRNVRLFCSADT